MYDYMKALQKRFDQLQLVKGISGRVRTRGGEVR